MNEYSVLTSVYGGEKPEYLKTAIDSMINQTVAPTQIVIVEDGVLTDGLYAVLDDYSVQYGNLITRVKLPENHGLGYALNEGLKHCSCEIVARMDTDDISLPTRCEKQLNEFIKDDTLCAVSAYIDEFEGSPDNITSTRDVPLTRETMFKYGKRRSPMNHPVVMYKKSAVLAAGGYPDLKRCQDFQLFGKMMFMGMNCKNIGEALLLFRLPETADAKKKRASSAKYAVGVVKEFHKWGYSSLWDYIVVKTVYALVGLIPIKLRKKFFKQIECFRKKSVLIGWKVEKGLLRLFAHYDFRLVMRNGNHFRLRRGSGNDFRRHIGIGFDNLSRENVYQHPLFDSKDGFHFLP